MDKNKLPLNSRKLKSCHYPAMKKRGTEKNNIDYFHRRSQVNTFRSKMVMSVVVSRKSQRTVSTSQVKEQSPVLNHGRAFKSENENLGKSQKPVACNTSPHLYSGSNNYLTSPVCSPEKQKFHENGEIMIADDLRFHSILRNSNNFENRDPHEQENNEPCASQFSCGISNDRLEDKVLFHHTRNCIVSKDNDINKSFKLCKNSGTNVLSTRNWVSNTVIVKNQDSFPLRTVRKETNIYERKYMTSEDFIQTKRRPKVQFKPPSTSASSSSGSSDVRPDSHKEKKHDKFVLSISKDSFFHGIVNKKSASELLWNRNPLLGNINTPSSLPCLLEKNCFVANNDRTSNCNSVNVMEDCYDDNFGDVEFNCGRDEEDDRNFNHQEWLANDCSSFSPKDGFIMNEVIDLCSSDEDMNNEKQIACKLTTGGIFEE